MATGLHRNFVIWAGLFLLLALLLPAGQAQEIGTFDDDDSDNDPNVCFTVPDSENCDWICGWYQAALNLDHVPLEAAQSVCPGMQRTSWRPGPPEPAEARDASLQSDIARYLDDDPTNDPNVCFESDDPNCDWEAGWYATIANIARTIQQSQSLTPAEKSSFQSFWQYYRSLEPQDDDDDPGGGNVNLGDVRWFCPPGVEDCPRPTNQCAPGQDPRNGGCYFHG